VAVAWPACRYVRNAQSRLRMPGWLHVGLYAMQKCSLSIAYTRQAVTSGVTIQVVIFDTVNETEQPVSQNQYFVGFVLSMEHAWILSLSLIKVSMSVLVTAIESIRIHCYK